MGKQKIAERKQARDLFVNSGLTLKECAAIVKATPAHVGKWAKEDKWDMQKSAQQVTSEKIIANYYGMLAKINNAIIATDDGVPTSAQADQISKITDSIYKLAKKNNLSMYYTVLKEFLNDLVNIDADAAKKFSDYLLDFFKRKASQLSNDL
jgi:ribosomal protein L17